jgi:8-oxo-dGTP pyrophosphatase MutT (NUDIX family)
MNLPNAPRTLKSTKTLASTAHTQMELNTWGRSNQDDLQRVCVSRPEAAAALVVNGAGQVLLIRQYREAVNSQDPIYEIVAGKVDPGETPLEAVIREVGEETNLRAEDYQHIKSVHASPGWTDETIHIYLATDVTATDQYSPDEEIELHWLDLDHAIELTQDAKSLLALYWLKSQNII